MLLRRSAVLHQVRVLGRLGVDCDLNYLRRHLCTRVYTPFRICSTIFFLSKLICCFEGSLVKNQNFSFQKIVILVVLKVANLDPKVLGLEVEAVLGLLVGGVGLGFAARTLLGEPGKPKKIATLMITI